eukprot:GHVO01036014.1.p1 GENE.GHVO01036014.1~~GHVO01036014.1.p1  ORF type:complete len:109 (+),score=19.92 GHVO01036014.1:107-433(+)
MMMGDTIDLKGLLGSNSTDVRFGNFNFRGTPQTVLGTRLLFEVPVSPGGERRGGEGDDNTATYQGYTTDVRQFEISDNKPITRHLPKAYPRKGVESSLIFDSSGDPLH